jgi:DNA repair exonuclease SbcCD ATPase subunit
MTAETSLMGLLGVVGLILAAGFGWLWRGAVRASTAQASELERERSATEKARAEAVKEKKARERIATDLAGYRKKADKTKRRQTKPASAPLGTASRIQDLESELAKRTRERDGLIAEQAEWADEKRRLERSLDVLRAEQIRAEHAAEAPAEPEAVAIPEATEPPGAELAEAVERIAKLENELVQARETEARMRKRMANQEQLYASLRAELEVKKDRLRAQEEKIQRLQALEVALSAE